MKSLNFWRSLFFSALAAAAFGACSDDDKTGDFEASITVDGKKATTVGIVAAGGETAAVSVVSAGPWTLAFESDQDWCLPNVTSGKGGTTELVFTADPMPESIEERSTTVVLTAWGWFYGVNYPMKASVTVRQSASGSLIPTTNVAKVRELLKAMNPSSTAADVTAEIAAMTITGIVGSESSGVNLGNNRNFAIQDEDRAQNSGLTINASSAVSLKAGQVVSIPLSGAKVSLYSGALQLSVDNASVKTVAETDAPEPVIVTPATLPNYESMLVQVDNCYPAAGYGTAWNNDSNKGNVNFMTAAGETFVCRVGAQCTFKDSLIPEKSGSLAGIAVIFVSNTQTVTWQVSPRTLDDIKLTEPIPAPEYKKATIGELKAGNYEVEATIVAVYQKGLMLADATGYTLVFNNDWKQPTSDPYNPYINDVDKKVTVKGTVSEFNGLLQFTAPEITVGDKSDYVLPTPPLTFDAAALTAYESNKKYEYVSITGTLVITTGTSYNTYTVIVPGYTAKTVTMAYGLDSYYNDKGLVTGDVVDITGFAIGFDTSKVNIMVREVNKNTSAPSLFFTSKPEAFAGSNPVAQTLNFEARNISALALEMFTFDGADKDKFNVDSQNGNSVTISAKGDNNSGAPYTATLVVTVDGTEITRLAVEQDAQLADGAVEVEFDYASIATVNSTVGDVSIACDKGGSTTAPAYNSSSKELRIYRYNTFTFSVPEGKKIIDIKFTFSSKSYMGYQISVDSGTYVGNTGTVSGAWTGEAQSVVFTNNGDTTNNVQARFKKIVVTYK